MFENLMDEYMDIPIYWTLYDQEFSPDGSLLAICDDRSGVNVYRVKTLINHPIDENTKTVPKWVTFYPSQKNLYALTSNKEDLIVGAAGEVTGWRWSEIESQKTEKSWTIEIPQLPPYEYDNTVNALQCDSSDSTAGRLFVATRSNDINVFDIETGTLVRDLKGHSDFVRCLSFCPSNNILASGCHKGEVRLWDTRSKSSVEVIKPFEHSEVYRENCGKFIDAIDLSQEWMVCGGGPRAALWHTGTRTISAVLPPVENTVHSIKMIDDKIFIGGAIQKVYQTDMEGNTIAEIQTSSSISYSLAIQGNPPNFLSITGSSAYMDICSPSVNYKQRTLLYKRKLAENEAQLCDIEYLFKSFNAEKKEAEEREEMEKEAKEKEAKEKSESK